MSDNDYLTANKLAAISTALMSDTPVSMAASLLPEGHILDTAAYRDAIRAVEKIIALRSRVEALEGENIALRSVVREAKELMDAYWESDSRSDAESVIRYRLLIDWHETATLLLATPANGETQPERKGGE